MRNINSLKNTSEFRSVYENGKSAANGLLVIYALATGGDEKRLGISVSKKVGNSVVRHRITRIIRECFIAAKPFIKPGYSLVVVARVKTSGKRFSDIYGAMIDLYKRLHVYSEEL